MRMLGPGSRVAVIGAGPGGLTVGKHAIEAGFDVTVFEASDDLGGQWHATAPHSGIWPGMRTNTSRAMTAFSDHPVPVGHDIYPLASQIHDYLHSYADSFGVTERIRFGRAVRSVRSGWDVDGEAFDAVVVASGRFCAPLLPAAVEGFRGEILHAYDYPGAEHFADRRVVIYGNGVSGHEIASDIATVTPVIHAYRKPRYVLQKHVHGVPSDWQWYTHVGALRRSLMDPQDYGRMMRDRVLRVAGNPAHFGAPEPDRDFLVAGHSLCQDYLAQVHGGVITCRPAISAVEGDRVHFADGTSERVDAIVCATGYRLDIPFLADELWAQLGPDLRLFRRTLHPDLPGLAFVGQFALQGPYLPLLELQARWIVAAWTGVLPEPDERATRAELAVSPPTVDAHNVLAVLLSDAAGVSPDLRAHPDLVEALLFGPMLPPRYRLNGPGARADAAELFAQQLATSPRPRVQPDDLNALADLGLAHLVSGLACGDEPTERPDATSIQRGQINQR